MLINDKKENRSPYEYGWLSPSGEFFPVEWGEHQSWALKKIRELYGNRWYERYHEAGETPGDILVDDGWVLIHNPAMGSPVITNSARKRLTRAQTEYLYDYFMKYGMRDEAKEVLEDE